MPINPSCGFQGLSGVQTALMGMDRVMGGERSIKNPAPPLQGFSTTTHGFDGVEIDNYSVDFSYSTDAILKGTGIWILISHWQDSIVD